MSTTRIETDSMGEIAVESSRYWGAQTQRSIKYFSIGNDVMPLAVIYGLVTAKKAAAKANYDAGILPKKKRDLIIQAADEILSGQLDEHFPLHVWMTGSGTQSNMNVNEVIANRAIELAGGVLGSKDPIHPNDHVNLSQSSNDVFPTAMYIATAVEVTQKLLPALETIEQALVEKSMAWAHIAKIGRTHMQDAVPLTLGQEFSGYAALIEQNRNRITQSLTDVYQLALGGTALGTGLNAPEGFAEAAAAYIAEETHLPFVTAPNKFAAQGSHDALVAMMGQIKTVATTLFKIANDIRLLSCGPRAGFHELILPENEPGSSIMPGKVNPTQCEALAMVAAQVIGNDTAVSIAGGAGYLEMNVYKPMIIFNILKSVDALSDSCTYFTRYCLEGMVANEKRIDKYVHESLMLVTALTPLIGYDKASEMAHYANEHDVTLVDANEHYGYLSAADLAAALDPYPMTKGGRVGK
jgi:fumarate hydratase class II